MDCAVDTTDRLSSMCPLMGIKPNSGTADAGAAVACPDAEVAGGLDLELAHSSLVFKSLDACFLELVACFLEISMTSDPIPVTDYTQC